MLYHRILLTGANGLVGQELVSVLSKNDRFDLLATGRDLEPRFAGGSCGYVPLDITCVEDIQQIFLDFAPSLVINCAALTSVDHCEEQKERCWKVNVGGVENLVKACRSTGTRFIQISTDFVFDGHNGPYAENDRPSPVNFYGKSKLAAENVVKAAGLKHWTIIRTVLVYGTGRNLPRSNIALWVIDNLGRRESIRVVTDQWRTPTYAPDLADGIERIVRFDKDGIYHISGREHLSVYDFARRVAQVFGLDESLIDPTDRSTFQQPAERPLNTGFIILKAETELGYRPRLSNHALEHLAVRLNLPSIASSR